MSKLHFDYWMEISFTEPVTESYYTIKCLPKDTDMQRITDLNIQIHPASQFERGEDSFGNVTAYGNVLEPHTSFGFKVSGIAETWLACGNQAEEEEYTGRYRYPFGLNKSGQAIQNFFEQLNLKPEQTNYEKSMELMKALHEKFIYEPGVTNVNTSAEDAWQLGRGVCQDYAHILIALCHLAKIPARYVTGMMVGEGYSHAWVEILSGDMWYGIDPTNDCIAGSTYIKIGAGRDANDCVINKGIMKGGGLQTQEVIVKVEELPNVSV